MHDLATKNFSLVPESNLRQFFLLLVFAVTMLLIHTIPVHHIIFTDWSGEYGKFVNFSADDAVYHMRLVHNTIHHFPWRIFFDPFTHFPFGEQTPFGPLFTLIIATTALIAGLGHPTPELINLIGAYTPVIMGVLCLIPVYFIARKLTGETAAIITSFIFTFSTGEFLQRSTLGFTDHHVAEVLFSTTTCAFLIYALNAAKIKKQSIIYSIFAGIAFGLFILSWPAALMFGAIFLVFFITQLIIDHQNSSKTEYLLPLISLVYGIPTLMILPYALLNPHLNLTGYSLIQPLLLVIMAATIIICYVVHLLCKKNQLAKDLYPLILTAIFTLIGFILYFYTPKLFTIMQNGCKLLFEPTPGMRTISEVRSSILEVNGDGYGITRIWNTYFWILPFATIGLGHLCYRVYKNANQTEVLLLVWTIIIILAALAQCRFNYYLAINAAILAGCYSVCPFFIFLGNLNPKRKYDLALQKIAICFFFCLFFIVVVSPIIMFILDKTMPSGIQITHERYNTYMWLKKHTPNPQGKTIHKDFDYTSGYYPIPKNPTTPYRYPKSAYGIMAWWDIGHQITYIAERIPNANPFQSGVVEKNNTLGAASFFTSSSEEKAVANLRAMGSRYVLIDNKNALGIMGIATWLNDTKNWEKPIKPKVSLPVKNSNLTLPVDSTKFLKSMLNQLYYDDANGLEHFRLIHESDGDYILSLRRAIFKPRFFINNTIQIPFEKYNEALKSAAKINRVFWVNKEKTVLAYHARPPTKNIKIFEMVKGAVIKGEVTKEIKQKTEVTLILKLKTKFGRVFTYKQTTKINNGKYKFIVPYPTTRMQGNDYSYDIKPMGDYQIKIGSKIIEVFVSEEAVMLGKSVLVKCQQTLV